MRFNFCMAKDLPDTERIALYSMENLLIVGLWGQVEERFDCPLEIYLKTWIKHINLPPYLAEYVTAEYLESFFACNMSAIQSYCDELVTATQGFNLDQIHEFMMQEDSRTRKTNPADQLDCLNDFIGSDWYRQNLKKPISISLDDLEEEFRRIGCV